MTYQNDPNRPLSKTMDEDRRSSAMLWGAIAVIALLTIGGFMFYNSNGDHTTTASNNSPSATQSTGGTGGTARPTPATPPAKSP